VPGCAVPGRAISAPATVLAERLQHVGVVDRGRVDYGGCPSSTRLTGTSSFRAGQGVRDSGHRMMLSGTWRGVFTGDDAQQAAFAAEAARAVRPRPVPPPRSGEQRKAALDAARQRNAELAGLRAGLQSGELTLAELLALAQSGHAAGRMLVRTALLALPGIRTARASQLMIRAGVGDGCRTGSLTAGQRERLVAAVAAMNPESGAAVASTTPAARQQAGQASPGNTKTTTPENTGDDRDQIARDRDLGIGEAVKAALLEQAAREQPLGHRAIGRQLGVSGTTIDSYCRKLMQTGVHYAECPHRFTVAGREAPGRKPAVAHPAST
jgi:hypothetical protein